ncbi:MAG: T9SS type A sorting domain-containing protein [Saprospiraceae bacterium]|nr:T9SS type A sorting domain-containing protein [Saprospiraceae bacterium]
MSIRCIFFSVFIVICYTLSGQNNYKWAEEPRIKASSNMTFLGVLNSGTYVCQSRIDFSISISDNEGQDWQNFGKLPNQFPDISNFLEGKSKDTLYYFSGSNDLYVLDKKKGEISQVYKTKKSFSDALLTTEGNPVFLARDSIIMLNNKAQWLKSIPNTFGDYLMGFPIENGQFLIINQINKTLSLFSHDLSVLINNQPMANNSYNKPYMWVNQNGNIYGLFSSKLHISTDFGQTFQVLKGQENFLYFGDKLSVNANSKVLGFASNDKFYFYYITTDKWRIVDNTNSQSSLVLPGEKVISQDGNSVYVGNPDNHLIKKVSLNFGPTNVSDIVVFENDFLFFESNQQTGIFNRGEFYSTKHLSSSDFLYMGDGSLHLGNLENFYLSVDRGKTFTSYRPNFFQSGNRLTKDLNNKLYFFTSTYFFTSIDNGSSWKKEDGNKYFPQFSAIKHDVKPHHSGNHFGRSDVANLIRYNTNGDVTTIHFNVNYVQDVFHHFDILDDMTALCFLENKSSKKQTLYRKSGINGAVSSASFPFRPANNTFVTDEEGNIYIHNGKNIFASLDLGTNWINISGDLPEDIQIHALAVGKDKTIYIACKGSNVRKSLFKLIKTNQLILETYRLNDACDMLEDEEPTTLVNYKIDNEIFTGNAIGGTTYIYLDKYMYGKEVEIVNYNTKVFSPCLGNQFILFTDGKQKMNFSLKELKSCSDLSVAISTPFLRRCFSVPIIGKVSNTGSKTSQNTFAVIRLDSLLTFESGSHNAEMMNEHTIKLYLGDIKAQETVNFHITVHVDCQASFQKLICFDASVNGSSSCESSASKDSLCIFPIGSFDPNDIQAFANGRNTVDYVEKDDQLLYRIRFQNTGTDTAFNVYITDTLPPELNPRSVRPIIASHDYSWELRDNVLLLKFENILLPDSNKNELLSNGYIDFKIEMSENTSNGERIENFADIYFDFNLPVRTNISSLIVGKPSSTDDYPDEIANIFPNPVRSQLYIQMKRPLLVDMISILDLNGKVVKRITQPSQKSSIIKVVTDEIPQGIYLVQIKDNQGRMFHRKFIKI